jgi:quinol monooxygenase YgiN
MWHQRKLSARLNAVKFIFEVRIKTGHTAEQYAAAWVRVSKLLQQAPGARGTQLHRKIGDPGTLIAIASWESKAARDAMDQHRDETVRAILMEAAHHCTINFLGEFEDPEWVVDRQPAQ